MSKVVLHFVLVLIAICAVFYFSTTILSNAFVNNMKRARIELEKVNANPAIKSAALKSFDAVDEAVTDYVKALFSMAFFLNVIVLSYAMNAARRSNKNLSEKVSVNRGDTS
jgi:hypothetical protein